MRRWELGAGASASPDPELTLNARLIFVERLSIRVQIVKLKVGKGARPRSFDILLPR